MPGTGHSHRYKGSISNRNTKSAFQVLAPWNAKKNGEKNQVAVSTGGDNLNFKLMGAKMMSNYHKDGDNFILDCSLTVLGNKIVDGSAIIHGNVEIDGTLEVKEKATFEKDVDICGNLRVWGKVTDLSDVDICGNLNANTGTFQGKLTNLDIHDGSGAGGIVTKYLTVTDNAYINTGDILHLVDVCDNILTLGNHNAATEEEVRGIVAKYIHANTDSSNVAFFGMDPSFNGGLVDDIHGQFVFILDVSENIGTIPADQIGGTLGRAAFGTLDICGSYLYGGGGAGTGYPTEGVQDQSNCQMHLVGKTIIACQTPAGGTCSSAQLDISGGIDVVGPSRLTDLSGALIDISGGNIDISGGDVNGILIHTEPAAAATTLGDIKIHSHQDVILIAEEDINICGGVGQDINIGGGVEVILINGAIVDISGSTVDISGSTVDISGGTTTIDAGGTLSIGPVGTSIAIGNPTATVDISGSTVGIDGHTRVDICGNTACLKMDALGATLMSTSTVVIGGGAPTVDISGQTVNINVGETHGLPLRQIKLTDGSGAYIDMSGGKIDISGDHVTLTGGPTSISLKSQTINIGEAGGTVDIKGTVQIDAGHIVIKDISATNIDVSGALTVNGGTIDMSGTNTAVGFQALKLNTTGSNNTATGYQALQDNTGNNNVGVGFRALYKNTTGHGNTAVGENTIGSPLGGVDMTGSDNVAMGAAALYQITDGSYNVATGSLAMYSNQGSANVAVGYRALNQNLDGSKNTALGHEAGLGQSISGHLQISNTINIGYDTSCNASNTACIGNVDISCVYLGSTSGLAKLDCSGIVSSGDAIINTLTVGLGGGNNATNTAIGHEALQTNITGTKNVAIGTGALQTNIGGSFNVATGYQALFLNTGSSNVATGREALQNNTIGNYNVATGSQTLNKNTSGNYNVATGYQALQDNSGGSGNTAIGYQALQDNSGVYNTAIGYIAGNGQTDISNTISVGYDTSCNASNTACIGNVDISCVYLGSINGNAKLDCSGIVSSGLVETTDISCGSIYADGVPGTSGQVLSSTGTGIEWVEGTTVGSHWNVDSDGIHNTSGENVGIGKDSSNNVALDVSGNMAINGTINTLTVGLGGGNNATNTAIGDSALGKSSVLSNPYNTAIGYHALFNNTIGSNNVAIGSDALGDNIDGGYNVAIGSNALQANIDGQYNVATGYQALSTNDASFNTAVGYQALTSNTNGGYNVAMGSYALKLNTNGGYNVAMGGYALSSTTGSENVAIGYGAGGASAAPNDASYNTAIGSNALFKNTGNNNVATGAQALYDNSGGSNNVATGYRALYSNIDGSNNTAIGYIAGKGQTDISNTINIGYDTSCNARDTACIGNADISCVYLGSINGNAKLDCSGIVSSGDAIINTLTVGLGGGNNATNTATGNHALFSNSSGTNNTAIGYQALNLNTTGNYNVAIGFGALVTNVDASANVAIGFDALRTCTSSGNTATGYQAMLANTDGVLNVANGYQAMLGNLSGNGNTAIGYQALKDNTTGFKNVALGHGAGNNQESSISKNTINIGYDTSCNARDTACIGNADISCVYLGSINGNAKLDCSGIVSSGLVETTDISCSSIYATKIGTISDDLDLDAKNLSLTTTETALISGNHGVTIEAINLNGVDIVSATSVKLSDGSGAHINMSDGNIDISGSGIVCSGVVIGSQGITLDGSSNIQVPSSTINFNTVTYNGNCGRFDISGTIPSGSSVTQTLTNSAIKATSIVFVSVIPNAYFGVPVADTYIADIHDGYVNITLKNTTGSSYTSVPGQQEHIQFMIINPST